MPGADRGPEKLEGPQRSLVRRESPIGLRAGPQAASVRFS